MRAWLVFCCRAAFLSLVLSSTALSQTGQSGLTGSVRDPQGRSVPSARVMVVEARTNLELETITLRDGGFAFPSLPPGEYTVRIEAPGFRTLSKSGVILNVSETQSTGTLVLELGEIAETVSVTADPGALQVRTASGDMGEVVTGGAISWGYRIRKDMPQGSGFWC